MKQLSYIIPKITLCQAQLTAMNNFGKLGSYDMASFTKFWNPFKHDFLTLTSKHKNTLILLFLIGFLARFINFFHLGFVYDLVTTQYDWAKNATDNGFISFWRDYKGSLDYLPGAIYIGMAINYVSKFFGLFGIGGDEYGFVFILKVFNTLNDILFAYLLYFIGKKYTRIDGLRLFIPSIISFLLPSLWFISSVWGQFDTFPVNLCIITTLLLYHARETSIVTFASVAGIIYGFCFWFKLQSILLFPPLILFFITTKNIRIIKNFTATFLTTTIAMLIIPLLANANRTGFVIAQVVIRSNNVSNGASTFWPLVNMQKYGSDLWFSLGRLDITASRVSYLVYILALGYLMLQIFPGIKKVVTKPKKWLSLVHSLPPLAFENFVYIMTISSSIYFFFFTKMMSRYLQFGFLFALIALTLQTKAYRFKSLLGAILVTEIGYFINNAAIYSYWNNTSVWTEQFENGFFGIGKVWLASWFHLVGIAAIYYLIVSFAKNDNDKKGMN